jgi:peptide/nickel transport system permease protein
VEDFDLQPGTVGPLTDVPAFLPSGITDEDPVVEAETRRRRRLGPVFWVSLGWVAIVIAAAVLANVLPIPSPTQVGLTGPGAGPSLHHLLGGDDLGRDELSRLIFGARVSLEVGFSATIIGLSVAASLGVVAGYFGGLLDKVITFLADTLLAFPGLVIALAVIAFVGSHLWIIIGALALGALPPGIRVFRGVTIRWARQDFVMAGRLLGARTRRLLIREIMPNMLPTAVAYGLISVSVVISIEAVLSYFGISVRPPTPSWGNMINEGTGYLQNYPYLVLWPSLALLLTILALNLLADQLQGVFDVKEGSL